MQVALIGGTLPPKRMRDRPRRADLVDLGIPCAVAVLAAVAMWMPAGSASRVALALAMLFFVPGHLLIAAFTRPPTMAGQRPMRALVALGVSPPLVGLLALSTSLLPGGFRPVAIVTVVTLACLVLAGVAAFRRRGTPAVPGEARASEGGDSSEAAAA